MKMITAAHCNAHFNYADGTNLVPQDFYDRSNRKIAVGTSVSLVYNSWCDCMKAGTATLPISAGNTVYHDDGPNQAYTITSVRSNTSQHIGDGVWLTGVVGESHYTTIWDDWHCGVSNDPNGWLPGHGVQRCGVKAGYRVDFGDSGGSVYFNHAAMGINAATGTDFFGNNPFTMYTRAGNIQNQLDVDICVNSSCT